jgi:hypothetical protein
MFSATINQRDGGVGAKCGNLAIHNVFLAQLGVSSQVIRS